MRGRNRLCEVFKNMIFDIEIMLSELRNRIQITLSLKTRKVLISVVAVCLVILTALGLCACLTAGTVENKIVKYQYAQNANVDYEVLLKPNLLYDQRALEMGKIYPSLFVEQLKTNFTYEFSGDKPADVKGNYAVLATVQGVQKEENKEIILWSKDFSLVPETTFNSPEGKVKLERELFISYESFNQFAQEVQKATEIVSAVNLSVKWFIQVEAQNEEGLVKDELTPQLNLPLGKKYFEVSGSLNPEKTGAIEEVREIATPINKKRIIFISIGMGLCFLVLLYLRLFVQVVTSSPWEKQIKGIFKKHGERLVALEKEMPIVRETIIKIKSLDNMVVLADELCKPIYYCHWNNMGKKSLSFFVLSENKVFSYDLVEDKASVTLNQGRTFPV